jgi:hypothetical protein
MVGHRGVILMVTMGRNETQTLDCRLHHNVVDRCNNSTPHEEEGGGPGTIRIESSLFVLNTCKDGLDFRVVHRTGVHRVEEGLVLQVHVIEPLKKKMMMMMLS